MTELDAVNVLLMSIGQSPVNTIEVSGIRDVEIAKLHVHNVSRSVQNNDWSFNTDLNVEMTRDLNDHILVPANALSIDPSDPFMDVVPRTDSSDGNVQKLWDRLENTFEFAEDITADISYFLPFEDIPQAARDYITMRAARRFQAASIGSQILYYFTKEEEDEARAALISYETRQGDDNFLNSFHARQFHKGR